MHHSGNLQKLNISFKFCWLWIFPLMTNVAALLQSKPFRDKNRLHILLSQQRGQCVICYYSRGTLDGDMLIRRRTLFFFFKYQCLRHPCWTLVPAGFSYIVKFSMQWSIFQFRNTKSKIAIFFSVQNYMQRNSAMWEFLKIKCRICLQLVFKRRWLLRKNRPRHK